MLPDLSIREQFSERLLNALCEAFPNSRVERAVKSAAPDQYDDIELRWIVPDAEFQQAVTRLPEILNSLDAVLNLRSDPMYQNSDRRRLVLARFASLPLFWRVELAMAAQSVASDPLYDNFNAAARGTNWSLPESALWSAVGAVKQLARGNPREAHSLLRHGFQRINVPVLPKVGDRELLTRLLDEAPKMEPAQAEFAAEVRALAETTLGPAS